MDSTQNASHKTDIEVLRKKLCETNVDFKSGDCAGPFMVTDNEKSLKITLLNFTGEPMDLEMEENEITSRIQSTPSPLLANCVILQTGKIIQIMFTKDIMSMEPLRAILVADMNYRLEKEIEDNDKKWACPKCHMAKFNSQNNLKVHEELYCIAKNSELNKNVIKGIEIPQNLILLPMAYHDLLQQNAVEVIGPVHTMVPVAIGRKSALVNTNPLFVHNRANLDIPPNLNISHPKLTVNIPVIDLDEKPSTSNALDLSTNSRDASIISLSPSCSPASKSSSNEPFYPDRPYSCTCGVSFSSQTTFDAHRQLYCSHTTRDSSSNGGGPNRNDASRKVPEKCGKCDFVPNSSSQLSMHIRSSHQITKTFTCLVCGYRAFSMRGVRTHMRYIKEELLSHLI
ncbi:hypothetical protein CAEBREN_01319 [Caenorhabditis brenneri]|uniref:C2H2-type domain-containing protein n=1 Tax=Caenorhabditis brenneri TaxID=135651 RepID=G0NJJ8_CAEBE|nr:hypothetical protein CAEBREN_01319 [Caenorhabditis brenneri]